MTSTLLSNSNPMKLNDKDKLLDTSTTSRPLTEPEQQMEESDDDNEHEPSLFDILDDDAEEDPERCT